MKDQKKQNAMQEGGERYKGVHKNRRTIFVNNLIGGVAWGVGSVLGATIVVGLLGLIFIKTEKIPIVGDFVRIVIEQVEKGQEVTNDFTTK
jgi:hypothetical protein